MYRTTVRAAAASPSRRLLLQESPRLPAIPRIQPLRLHVGTSYLCIHHSELHMNGSPRPLPPREDPHLVRGRLVSDGSQVGALGGPVCVRVWACVGVGV